MNALLEAAEEIQHMPRGPNVQGESNGPLQDVPGLSDIEWERWRGTVIAEIRQGYTAVIGMDRRITEFCTGTETQIEGIHKALHGLNLRSILLGILGGSFAGLAAALAFLSSIQRYDTEWSVRFQTHESVMFQVKEEVQSLRRRVDRLEDGTTSKPRRP